MFSFSLVRVYLYSTINWDAALSDQLKAVMNKCVFSSVLKLVRDEADRTLLGRELQT